MSTQTTEKLSQRVIELASDQTDIPKEQISLKSQFVADLGFDSLDKVEFMMTIEDEYDISIPDENADTITTIQNAINEIQKLIYENHDK